ncbi:unnamed protein product [Phaedon cochleariae]|uniref:Uncharacterized protein n=1 Tax=Phaedon cochleariae TaxID=80249 RepID=A0A9P0GP87_PHACE|nr:unnamed protein product [Phaedon cochleariae]
MSSVLKCQKLIVNTHIFKIKSTSTVTNMSKGFITNLCTKGPPRSDQSISLQESVHNTSFCSRPNSMNSGNRIPCSQHHMIQVCQIPSFCTENKTVSKHKSRTRSKSPGNSQKNKKSVTFPDQNWATVFRTNSVYSGNDMGDNQVIDIHYAEPKRTCSCVSNGTSFKNGCVIKSRSRLQVSNSSPIHAHVVQQSICPEQLTGLKNEIEIVRTQLEKMAKPDPANLVGKGEPEQYAQLKSENKHLKRELELKRKLYLATLQDVERAKDILSDYEKKVALLHDQAVKSSKIMKQSKDKFCKCVKEKEKIIKELKDSNADLLHSIREKEIKYVELNKTFGSLQSLLHENSEQHANNNQNFSEAIKTLQKQLDTSLKETEQYKDEVKKLEEQLINFECKVCERLEAKAKKQKEKFDSRMKEQEQKESSLNQKISELSSQVEVAHNQKSSYEQLQNEFNELQAKIEQYETLGSRYNFLEEKYQEQCYLAVEKERDFERDRGELKKLVDELTDVIKQNKATVLQLSDINKQQEALIASQSAILLEKDEKMKMAESEIEMLRTKSEQLEEEIYDLKKALDGPCSKNACLSLSKELEELRIALEIEKDNKLVKEKIIEDQSQTITGLQVQMKEKLRELSIAKQESNVAEEEIMKINDDLMMKHRELEREMHEKEHLMQKLKKLEYQKSALSKEMSDLEILLQNYCEERECDEDQQQAIQDIQKQVAEQKREWEKQKALLADEKEKAVNAAKFATQKLLDTVADFQRQVEAQKKVQVMLTRMLHDKEEQLKMVQLKMSSINSITADREKDYPLDEIYKRSRSFDLSNPATTTSVYSSCSNCSKCKPTCQKNDLVQLFEMLTRTEEPSKDS